VRECIKAVEESVKMKNLHTVLVRK